MIKNFKSFRKGQRMRSEYNKVKKKLCKPCLKGLSLSFLEGGEVKDYVFCSVCNPLISVVLKMQDELGEEANREIVEKFNKEKVKVVVNE